jgi:hypothetical protein
MWAGGIAIGRPHPLSRASWPITAPFFPSCNDWFGLEHVIQAEPIRTLPGTLAGANGAGWLSAEVGAGGMWTGSLGNLEYLSALGYKAPFFFSFLVVLGFEFRA